MDIRVLFVLLLTLQPPAGPRGVRGVAEVTGGRRGQGTILSMQPGCLQDRVEGLKRHEQQSGGAPQQYLQGAEWARGQEGPRENRRVGEQERQVACQGSLGREMLKRWAGTRRIAGESGAQHAGRMSPSSTCGADQPRRPSRSTTGLLGFP